MYAAARACFLPLCRLRRAYARLFNTTYFWGYKMKDYIEERVLEVAQYIIDNNSTVRGAARIFNVSKSTVHKDVHERLFRINRDMYRRCRAVLDKNKAERHIRGGLATREKYKRINEKRCAHL